MPNVQLTVTQDILFYAFRYALGRMTYAVSDVAAQIERNAHLLSNQTKNLIIKEIAEADRKNQLGMEMDTRVWLDLKETLERNV